MSERPDFEEAAQAWLVRAQGHSRIPHEKSLGEELRRIYELGAAHSIEAVRACADETMAAPCCSGTLTEAIEAIRDATTGKGIKP